ncbi:MAG: ATP-binding cassette domain-containing protein, partial [Bradyrhizobiaceae bacterium]|nr:ATP-binding cassette domain-containing protein [Bradyrhizobiaceae bacterium]
MSEGTTEQPLLCVRGLAAGYGDVQVLWGIDLDVPRNSIVSIVGPNGAGKTTLL